MTLWEAYKEVARGQCIAIGSRIKKEAALLEESLSGRPRALEQKLATSPSIRILQQINAVRSKLKTLALGRTEKLLFVFLPEVL